MLSFSGCSDGFKYETYDSKDPELNIVMKYVAGWSHVQQRGSYASFVQAVFYEPKREDKVFKARIVAHVENISKAKFTPLTVDGKVDDLIEKRMKFGNSKLLSSFKTGLAGLEAKEIEVAYETFDNNNSLAAKLIQVRERMVIVKRGDRFYTFRYENTAGEFDKLNKAFTHIIKSIKFKD